MKKMRKGVSFKTWFNDPAHTMRDYMAEKLVLLICNAGENNNINKNTKEEKDWREWRK